MKGSARLKSGLGLLLLVLGVGWFAAGLVSCGLAPTPFIVQGPGRTGNDPPTLTIEVPNDNVTRDQGGFFLIRWQDTDRDSNAQISFALVNTVTNEVISLVNGIDENDLTGPDQFSVGTSLIPIGAYSIRGIIDDGVNPPVEVYALVEGAATEQRVVVTIVEPGGGRPTVPPVITVTEPRFSRSVAQDDVLVVTVQPTELVADATRPFDPDSDITLYILLDVDQDPNNDDPANPDSDQIIYLQEQRVEVGTFEPVTFNHMIDLATIPPRPGGAPYYIRATADDGTNPRVHQYAVGTISVVQLAAGEVDLYDIGRSKSGARFYGFNPGANLGSSISHIGDFDADGVDDFALIAQYGNPRNLGRVGEGYLVYGQDGIRFGGSIGVNSVSESVDGVLIEAPPVREQLGDAGCPIPGEARSDGITDVDFIRDLSGDGRPEILFGCPHVHGAFEAMDFDPGDQDLGEAAAATQVEWVFRHGRATRQEGTGDPVVISRTYSGVDDVMIDSSAPDTSSGSATGLSWRDAGVGQRMWGLIKFSDILTEIWTRDFVFDIDITTVSATLELRVFNTGGDGELFQAVTDFTEQTSFAGYAVNGGEPQLDVDYVGVGFGDSGLGTVDGGSPETVTVDVTTLVQQLIDGQLRSYSDELRFIIVPDPEDGADESAVRSSEFSVEAQRPTVRIEYTLRSARGARGCYPDDLVNNLTDTDNADRYDYQWYAGGMAVLLDSGNRDNSPRRTAMPERLETTSIALELVGQDGRESLTHTGIEEAGGSILARADDYQEESHIAGARFTAGWYDCVDHLLLNQPARDGLFGQNVASIGDLNNDEVDEIVVSAPRNERYLRDLEDTYGTLSTHRNSTRFHGSVAVIPGADYNNTFWRERATQDDSSSSIPLLDQQHYPPFGRCQPVQARGWFVPTDIFEVFAEDVDDMLGGAQSAGDFNQDGLDDILCGAPLNDRGSPADDTREGAAYVLYGRNVLSDFDLKNADDPLERTPMLRIRGVSPGDQIGWRQATGLDVNGDRIDDVFIASPTTDFGSVTRATCGRDYDGNGLIDAADFSTSAFNRCRRDTGEHVFSDDICKVFDYNNDDEINDEDEKILFCLYDGGGDACCEHLVDNGFVGIIFGGVFTDGDRTIEQIATPDLPGAIFYGSAAGHRAGIGVSSAGDFNQDGFGDLLIAVPGETRLDRADRLRLGVVYLVFGGTHLYNTRWSLDEVGSEDLPGIVFLSPYAKGRPNEAAPTTVAFVGDINRDGFGDIAIGNPLADFIDLSFPQGPNATDAELGRRRDAGDAYIVYGNNFGSNRGTP